MLNETVLVYDNGSYFELALRLARDFDRVLYFLPWKAAFPRSSQALIGSGFDDVERVLDFWKVVPEIDLFVFPDTYDADLQEHLKEMGKLVWGNGDSQRLELDRWFMRQLQKDLKMNFPRTRNIKGVGKLEEVMQKEEDFFVKTSVFRGDMETFHHSSFKLSRPWLDELKHWLGPRQDTVEFIVENKVEGVEVGYDGWCVDGQFPPVCCFGYEVKDQGFAGRCLPYAELPNQLVEVNQALAPSLQELGCRGFLSTEIRIGKNKEGFLIDPCLRAPSPPIEGMMEIYDNLGEILLAGSQGEIVEPIPNSKYFALATLSSPWVEKHWLAVDIPDEIRTKVKCRYPVVIDKQLYIAPQMPLGQSQFGMALGFGNTIEEAIADVEKVAEEVDAHELDYDIEALQQVEKVIAEGEKVEVEF